VPTAVSTVSSNRNQVMIQKESGFAARPRRKAEVDCGELCAATTMNPATISVGTSATYTSKNNRNKESPAAAR